MTVRVPVFNQTYSAVDKMYIWEAEMPPVMENWASAKLKVTAGNGSSKEFDITFGDVLFCTGQSNMKFPMKKIANATTDLEHGKWDERYFQTRSSFF